MSNRSVLHLKMGISTILGDLWQTAIPGVCIRPQVCRIPVQLMMGKGERNNPIGLAVHNGRRHLDESLRCIVPFEKTIPDFKVGLGEVTNDVGNHRRDGRLVEKRIPRGCDGFEHAHDALHELRL